VAVEQQKQEELAAGERGVLELSPSPAWLMSPPCGMYHADHSGIFRD
jgi:hypothetical protein